MKLEEKISKLRGVNFLSELDSATLAEVARQASVRQYAANQRIVTELEFGDEVFVIARGQAQISVCPRTGKRLVLGEIGPGAAFGEMASITGELRSATVVAVTSVQVLVLSDRLFDRLRVARPQVAVSLVKTLAARLVEVEHTLSTLLSDDSAISLRANDQARRSSLSILWRELVVNHHKEPAFLALIAFVATLILVRIAVFVALQYQLWPRQVLRVAYVTGFILVMLSACAAILTFRPNWRRSIMVAFGIGAALIANELGVTLAFDIFFKEGYTPDPNLPFDIEKLYRRTEPVRASVIGLVVLLQAVYLGAFYRRVWHLLGIEIRRLLRRR